MKRIPHRIVALAGTVIMAANCAALLSPDAVEDRKGQRPAWLALLGLPAAETQAQSGEGSSDGTRLEVRLAYQASVELLDQVGKFYHRKAVFPAVQEISAISTARLTASLQKAEQSVDEYDLFFADARQGLLLFLVNGIELGALQHQELKSLTQLAVLPDGRVGFVTGTGRINLCFYYDGHQLLRRNPCSELAAADFLDLAAFETGSEFLVLRTSGLSLVNATSGYETPINVDSILENPVSIATHAGDIVVLEKGGFGVTVFQRGAEGEYRRTAGRDEVTVLFPEGRSSPYSFADIALNAEGYIYLLSRSRETWLALEPGSLVEYSYMKFPALPAPLRRLTDVRQMATAPEAGFFAICSPKAVSIYSENDPLNTRALHYIPPALQTVMNEIDEIPPYSFEPARSLLDYPEVRDALQAAEVDLQLN
jgi:hypothetical protein